MNKNGNSIRTDKMRSKDRCNTKRRRQSEPLSVKKLCAFATFAMIIIPWMTNKIFYVANHLITIHASSFAMWKRSMFSFLLRVTASCKFTDTGMPLLRENTTFDTPDMSASAASSPRRLA